MSTVPALPPLDHHQRYTINESVCYLKIGRSRIYDLIRAGEIRTIRDGSRVFIPGTEIARRSTLPAE